MARGSDAYDIVLPGVPVTSRRGALGWCNVVLVRRGRYTLLFDTGSNGDRAALLAGLGALGVAPEDVDLIVASHFHYDHIVNAEIFSCPIVMSEAERRYVETEGYRAADDPFVPRALIPFARHRFASVAEGDEVVPSVRAVLLPGHTPGSMGLLLADDGVLLAGDAVKNAWDFVRGAPPPAFYSSEVAGASLARVRGLADTIVPGHDRPFRLLGDGSVAAMGGTAVTVDCYADPGADSTPFTVLEPQRRSP